MIQNEGLLQSPFRYSYAASLVTLKKTPFVPSQSCSSPCFPSLSQCKFTFPLPRPFLSPLILSIHTIAASLTPSSPFPPHSLSTISLAAPAISVLLSPWPSSQLPTTPTFLVLGIRKSVMS